MEPWKLKKEANVSALRDVLAVTMETARIAGILLQPIVPSFSSRLLGRTLLHFPEILSFQTLITTQFNECFTFAFIR